MNGTGLCCQATEAQQHESLGLRGSIHARRGVSWLEWRAAESRWSGLMNGDVDWPSLSRRIASLPGNAVVIDTPVVKGDMYCLFLICQGQGQGRRLWASTGEADHLSRVTLYDAMAAVYAVYQRVLLI